VIYFKDFLHIVGQANQKNIFPTYLVKNKASFNAIKGNFQYSQKKKVMIKKIESVWCNGMIKKVFVCKALLFAINTRTS